MVVGARAGLLFFVKYTRFIFIIDSTFFIFYVVGKYATKAKNGFMYFCFNTRYFFNYSYKNAGKTLFYPEYSTVGAGLESFMIRAFVFILTASIVVIYSRLSVKSKKYVAPMFVYVYLTIAFFTGILLLLLASLYEDSVSRNMRIALVIFAVGIVAVNLMVSVFYIRRQSERDSLQVEVILKEKMLRLQKEYFQDMVASYHDLRAFRHDVNGYFTMIQRLLADKRYEELEKLTKGLKSQIKGNPSGQCENIYIGAVLNHFYEICQREGIAFHFDYQLLHELQMSEEHICSLFYNLLENAVEAARRSEEKIVDLKIHSKDQALIIQITNSVSIDFTMGVFEEGKSTKENSEYHGIGLQNIRSVVAQYDGIMDKEWKNNRLVMTIILFGVLCLE